MAPGSGFQIQTVKVVCGRPPEERNISFKQNRKRKAPKISCNNISYRKERSRQGGGKLCVYVFLGIRRGSLGIDGRRNMGCHHDRDQRNIRSYSTACTVFPQPLPQTYTRVYMYVIYSVYIYILYRSYPRPRRQPPRGTAPVGLVVPPQRRRSETAHHRRTLASPDRTLGSR